MSLKDYQWDFNNPSFHGYGNEIKKRFALRDFAFSHILQRKFFAEFGFDEIEDEEILSKLMQRQYVQGFGFKRDNVFFKDWLAQFDEKFTDDTSKLEKNLDTLSELLSLLEQYKKRIEHHVKRLERYVNATATIIADNNIANLEEIKHRYKIGRGLKDLYWTIYREIESLAKKITDASKILDNEVRHTYRKIFADRLKFARQATKLSQKAFAPKIGMSQNGYALYETGQRDPSIPTLIRLSKILNRSTDWLLGQSAW